jgi:hypothetical protein
MSKEKQLYEILRTLQKGEIGTDLAHLQILRLFSVVGRSESFVCGHPPNVTYLNDGVWHCEKCGGKWDSLANK